MRDCQLFDHYSSLIFIYCDEHLDFTTNYLAKLVEKRESSVIFRKKNEIRLPQRKTEVKMIKSFKIWKLIAEKH